MRFYAAFIVFVFMISNSRSLRINLNHQRRGDALDDIFASKNKDEVLSPAVSDDNDMGLLADEDSLFHDDLEPSSADLGGVVAQGSSCGEPSKKRDTAGNDLILGSPSSFFTLRWNLLMTTMIM